MKNNIVIVRGAGDLASGTIYKLHKSGFQVLALETNNPTSIRRKVCYSEAVYENYAKVEDSKAILVKSIDEIFAAWKKKLIPIMIDPNCKILNKIRPAILVDAILAKKNVGTNINMADCVIALGPGFQAKKDVHAVIETMRGHQLGRVILDGFALKDTSCPGSICGYTKERVIYSPSNGNFKPLVKISDIVESGDTIGVVDSIEIKTQISGIVRGVIRDGFYVYKGLKIADVDPRLSEIQNCFTISDKARSIAGGVLEAILYFSNKKINSSESLNSLYLNYIYSKIS